MPSNLRRPDGFQAQQGKPDHKITNCQFFISTVVL
jgi:hypothetical protein